MGTNLQAATSMDLKRLFQVSPGPLTPPTITALQSPSTTGGTLSSSTGYWYRVTATNGAGESLPSPSNVYYLGATGTNTNQILLAWTQVLGATGYKVYRGTAAGSEVLVATVSGATTYTDTGSSVGTAQPTSDSSGSAAEASVYTVPAGYSVRLDEVVISNQGTTAATAAIGIVPSGGSLDGTHWVVPPFSIAAGDTRVITLHQGLDTGDQISIAVSARALTVTGSGLRVAS